MSVSEPARPSETAEPAPPSEGVTPAGRTEASEPSGQPPARPVLVLVGPPGSGKTTVGRLLAERWGTSVCDTDDLVEQAAGKPIAEIFVDDGEAAFRALESVAVDRALTSHSGVLSLGGGAVTVEANRTRLRGHRVVFLDVGLAAAASRVGLGTTRPLLLGNVRSRLKALMDARRPLYQEVAEFVVDTDDLSAAAVADTVAGAVSDAVERQRGA